MPKAVSVEYLEMMRDDLTKQAEQHYANWQATLGAIDLLTHLVEVANAPQPEQPSIDLVLPAED